MAVLAARDPQQFDLAGCGIGQERQAQRLGPAVPVHVTSSATGAGLEALTLELLRTVPALPGAVDVDLPEVEHMVFRPGGPGFTVERAGEGFVVSGPRVDRLIARHDLDNEEALAHVERTLHRMGVIRELEALGFVETMRAEGFNGIVHTAAASNLGQMLVRLCAAENIPLVNIVRSDMQHIAYGIMTGTSR